LAVPRTAAIHVRDGSLGLDKDRLSSDTRRMGVDAELLRDAEAARDRLIASQHAAEQAKADYHHAIRRLHAAGGSLREIAEALRLSHQRVHQIIDDADRPRSRWWRRAPRPLEPAPPDRCSFCGRSREECAKLIAGPGLCICDACVARASRLASGAAAVDQAAVALRLEGPGSAAKCSFCGKQARRVQHLVASSVVSGPTGKVDQAPRICNECLALCEEILATTASST
jgi:ClpX C4-type zinc finger